MSLARLRNEYTQGSLTEQDMHPDPFTQFHRWLKLAIRAKLPEPTAMTLATATPTGTPSARIVLLKHAGPDGFTFFTNYSSRKSLELTANPHAALVFYWDILQRQIRITGRISRASKKESQTYFHSRPRNSQIAAWASEQSLPITTRQALDERFKQLQKYFRGKTIPLPPHWGGYRLQPVTLEFWQGRPNRLHDRFLYTRARSNRWSLQRLAP